MTHFTRTGWKADTILLVTSGRTPFPKGTRVKLLRDDGSMAPAFEGIDGALATDGDRWSYVRLEDLKPSPLQLPAKTGTPFERTGWTKDTRLVIKGSSLRFDAGTVVTLHTDDGTDCPRFQDSKGITRGYVNLRKLSQAAPVAPSQPSTESTHQSRQELIEENLSLATQIKKLEERVADKRKFFAENAAVLRSLEIPAAALTLHAPQGMCTNAPNF